uniref:Tetraspanin n=1 Tax=Bursaphelenchus xylophilus TaxID=6326 RepID=A0A1I7RR67_BURXY
MHVAHYRVWIYSANLAVILIQLWFIYASSNLLYDPYLRLLPLNESSILIYAITTVIPLQFIACFCGLVGVYFSKRTLVRLYWTLMIPLIIMDTVAAFIWIHTFNDLHTNIGVYLNEMSQAEGQIGDWTEWCNSWNGFLKTNKCCAPKTVEESCWDGLQCDSALPSCHLSLLAWLHGQTDGLAGILYFLLYPLKLTVVFVLREDVMELVTEIFYSNHKGEYK